MPETVRRFQHSPTSRSQPNNGSRRKSFPTFAVTTAAALGKELEKRTGLFFYGASAGLEAYPVEAKEANEAEEATEAKTSVTSDQWKAKPDPSHSATSDQ